MGTRLERLAISCGGTGGHFNPGLSIARTFKERGGRAVLLLGGIHAKAQTEAAARFGLESFPIASAPMPKCPVSALRFLAATAKGTMESRAAIKESGAQAVLAMGSFASLPPALAAKLSGVPFFLHDGNAKVGRANKFLSRFAEGVALSFPAVNAQSCRCPSTLTGMPVRPELLAKAGRASKAEAVAWINSKWAVSFKPDVPTLLVFGGSLGADSINKRIPEAFDSMNLECLQVIRLCGPGKLEEARERLSKFKFQSLTLESCQEMDMLYSAADMVVCRAGGSTVSELAIFGKYAILIPFPYAADAHQDDNAAWLAAAGGATVLKEGELTAGRMAELLSSWLADPAGFSAKGLASKSLSSPDASLKVISMIEDTLEKQGA